MLEEALSSAMSFAALHGVGVQEALAAAAEQ